MTEEPSHTTPVILSAPHQATTEGARLMDTPATDPLTGDAIREARERIGYSQETLGAMLHPPVRRDVVYRWEKGDYKPKSPRREQLAKILGISLHGDQGGNVGVSKEELSRELSDIVARVTNLLGRL